jgi:hypothetical protein
MSEVPSENSCEQENQKSSNAVDMRGLRRRSRTCPRIEEG